MCIVHVPVQDFDYQTRRRGMRTLIATIFLVLFASAAFGQGDRGTITGTVTDTSGAVVANVQVQAKQAESGAVFSTVTTDTGNYTLTQLPIGPYEVTATVAGLKKYVRSGLRVGGAQT